MSIQSVQQRKRALILKLRRTVKVQRRFNVKDLGDGREEQTCRECGYVEVYTHEGVNPILAKKLIAYRADGSGVSGTCPKCSKERARERYPLPDGK